MKKILTLIALLTGTALVYGQGTVVFYTAGGTYSGNYTNITGSPYAGLPGPGAVGTGGLGGGLTSSNLPPFTANAYYYTMLIDTATPTSANPLTGGWTQAYNNATGQPLMATNFVGPGSMDGPNGPGYTELQNEAAGTQLYFELIGWSANLGTTWAQVAGELAVSWSNIPGFDPSQNYFFGVAESVGEITLGASTGPGAIMYGGNGLATGQPGALTMDAIWVPEPGTLALAGLGGLSLLLFRRRK